MDPILSGISALRNYQTDRMYDTCKLLTPVEVRGTAGSVSHTYNEGTELLCGFEPAPGSERRSMTAEPVTWEATIRLPFGTVVSEKQMIRITSRWGIEISPVDYEIVSPPQEGPTAVRVRVKKVQL